MGLVGISSSSVFWCSGLSSLGSGLEAVCAVVLVFLFSPCLVCSWNRGVSSITTWCQFLVPKPRTRTLYLVHIYYLDFCIFRLFMVFQLFVLCTFFQPLHGAFYTASSICRVNTGLTFLQHQHFLNLFHLLFTLFSQFQGAAVARKQIHITLVAFLTP